MREVFFFFNQQINKVTSHFTFMRRAQNTGTRALKQHRLSPNISPVCSSFVLVIVSDMHIERGSEKRTKTLIFTQLKISRCKQHFFAIFRSILRNSPPTYLLWSDHRFKEGEEGEQAQNVQYKSGCLPDHRVISFPYYVFIILLI